MPLADSIGSRAIPNVIPGNPEGGPHHAPRAISTSPFPQGSARRAEVPARDRNLESRNLLSITFSGPNNSGVATITGDNDLHQFAIRLKPGDSSTIELSDNGGSSFTDASLAGITQIDVNGVSGRNRLTIDESNGLIGGSTSLPIKFNGGPANDILMVVGNPGAGAGTVSETFTAGSTADAGTLTIGNGSISATVTLTSVERLVDLSTADTLTINAPPASKIIHLRQAPKIDGVQTNVVQAQGQKLLDDDTDMQTPENTDQDPGQEDMGNGADDGQVPDTDSAEVNAAFLPIQFANKTHLVINAVGGDNLIVLTIHAKPAAGLTSLTVNGSATGTNVIVGSPLPSSVTLTTTNITRTDTDADDMLIDELFSLRLNRIPASSELAFWRNVLAQSGMGGVATGIEESMEALTLKARHFYERYLGREAKNGEEQFWVHLLARGETEEQVLANFLSSKEFFDRAQTLVTTGTPDQRWIGALYQLVLNRPPSSSELSYWMTQLGGSTRTSVALQFAESLEFRGEMLATFFSALLNRDPDDAGMHFWLNSPDSLEQMRTGFESSEEFASDLSS
jgi:hypothetical protein